MPNLPATEYPPRELEWIEQYQIGYYDISDVYPNQYSNISPSTPAQAEPSNKLRAVAIEKYQNTRDRSSNRTQVSIRIDPAVANAARKANLNVSRICEDALAEMVAAINSSYA